MPKLNEDLNYWLAYSFTPIFNNAINTNSINPFIFAARWNFWKSIGSTVLGFLRSPFLAVG
jgi:hypothetical protein